MKNRLKPSVLFLMGILLYQLNGLAQVQPVFAPDGFAAAQGTTGGGNATPVTVSSASAFRSAISGSSSKVVIVNGNINLGGNVSIGSNTTLIGATTSSGLYGGTVQIRGSNYIIQNLSFGPAGDDVMEISGATRVFITKCEFHDSTDELCSIVRQADYVTISWSRFYFNSPDSHSFAHLIGNGDGVTADRGRLHVTLHHNWYDNGVRGRQPRVRFGQVHLYNNYFNSNNTDYCIGVGVEANIRIENSHFDNVEDPWADYGGAGNGVMGWSGLLFEGSSQPGFISNSYPAFSVPYSFSPDPVNQVESLVRSCAGNVTTSCQNPGPVNYTLSTNASPSNGGTITLSPSGGTYEEGTVVTATVNASNGYDFVNWSGASESSSSTIQITMDGSKSLTANFRSSTGGTTIQIQENANGFCNVEGSIDNNNGGFTGNGFANTENTSGSGIEWTVNASTSGSYSLQWRHANGSADNRTGRVLINESEQISNVDFTSTGSWTSWTNSGIVTVNLPAGNNLIRLEATNGSGLSNIDWVEIAGNTPTIGNCDGSGPEPETYNLTTAVTPSNGGTITFNPSGGSYLAGTVVTLTANPSNGFIFNSWSGDVSGGAATVTLTMDGNKNVNALFEASSAVTITIQEEEAGFCYADGSIDNDNGGFSGSGFVNTDNSNGNGIEWAINGGAGTYTFNWRFANGTADNRTGVLIINESQVATGDFNSTGSWTSWTNTSVTVTNVAAGSKTIRLEANQGLGLANIDYLQVDGPGVSVAGCVSANARSEARTISQDLQVQLFPNPFSDFLTIHLGEKVEGKVEISFINLGGREVRNTVLRGTTHRMDVSDLPKGLYLIRVIGEYINYKTIVVK